MFSELLGNAVFKENITAALAAGRLPHAILICGEDGLGRSLAANLVAAAVLATPGGKAALQGGRHSLARIAAQAGQTVKVEQVRSAKLSLVHTNLAPGPRVVLVENAHNLTPAAANALLKTLEEPGDDIYFILTATGTGGVLPTLLSRCGVYPLAEAGEKECVEYLAAVAPGADAALLYAVFGGRPGFCKYCALNPAGQAALQKAISAACFANAGQGYELAALLSGLEGKKEDAMALLTVFSHVVAGAVLRPGHKNLPGLTPALALAASGAANTALQALFGNANLKLTLTWFAAALAV